MPEIDRTSWDPFAPRPASSAATTGTEPADEGSDDVLPDNLDTLSHAELVALAEHHDIPSYGTKAQIAQRLRDRVGTG